MGTRTRTVLVTGSGGPGCGRAIARRFARSGASVLVSDIDDAGGAETVRLIEEAGGGQAFYCHADVRDESDVVNVFAACKVRFGVPDVLVNNASATHDDSGGMDGWMASIDTDLIGAIRTTKHAVAAMRRAGGGAIVNIASISALWHGRLSPGGFEGYDVANAGLMRMTTRLAPLADTDGIRVNCLAPGWIDTPDVRAYWTSLTPIQRAQLGVPETLLDPADVADLVARMADDESLSGRVVVWWSEDSPRLIRWGDRGYRDYEPF
jgi:NAD(P)-dependent dehydrogenase (short-subunit alcohol dehydrogenase family)